MEKVKASKLSVIAMVAGQEKKTPIVIDNGIIKEWIGFGWIEKGSAEEHHYDCFPEVERD